MNCEKEYSVFIVHNECQGNHVVKSLILPSLLTPPLTPLPSGSTPLPPPDALYLNTCSDFSGTQRPICIPHCKHLLLSFIQVHEVLLSIFFITPGVIFSSLSLKLFIVLSNLAIFFQHCHFSSPCQFLKPLSISQHFVNISKPCQYLKTLSISQNLVNIWKPCQYLKPLSISQNLVNISNHCQYLKTLSISQNLVNVSNL